MKSINTSNFAYFMGNFMADGSFYSSGNSNRFEFVDGSPYENELKYSLEHMIKIKSILESFLDKQLPNLRRKGNKFILKFRSKYLSKLFIKEFNLFPGKKHRIIDIPLQYRNSIYEVDFWRGFLDGDGSIARNSRRIAVESMSKAIIDSFADFLSNNKILFSKYKSPRKKDFSYVVLVKSVSFRDFASKIGFNHPCKSKLLKEKLKDKDFFVQNKIIMKIGLINYLKIFDDSIYIENGRNLLIKYGDKSYHRPNVRANKAISLMQKYGLDEKKILKEIMKYRFKKSKGSKYSIKLPPRLNKNILRIAKFVRLRAGGISFSRIYIESFKESFKEILDLVDDIFDIKPKYTCKNEPIFCSGVLNDFFNAIIKRG